MQRTIVCLGLALGAPPTPAVAARVVAALVADIEANSNHSTGGIVGMAWIFKVLDQYGAGDAALSMLLQDTVPSFGRMVQQGATTLWENWNASRHDTAGSSLNHVSAATLATVCGTALVAP